MTHETSRELVTHAFHMKTIWSRFLLMLLGLWLLTSPETFGYDQDPIRYSDWTSGILLIVVGISALRERRLVYIGGATLIGLWLQAAPLLFLAEEPVAYLNDTLIGLLAISFSLLLPLRPPTYDIGPHTPPGWTYNPSSWPQRLPVIFCAVLCWFIARYLTAYQLHYIDTIWDPLFGSGSQKVLGSSFSRAFPLPDAGIGAMAYSLEAILGAKGGIRRWHTMPWIVVAFGILTIPLGLVSLALMLLQPFLVGAWCGWCLLMMLFMVIMLALTLDELLATCQYLRHTCAQKKPFWHTFFMGSDYDKDSIDLRTPSFDGSPKKILKSMFWGMLIPWNLLFTGLLGALLLCYASTYNQTVCGLLILLFSLIACAEIARPLRLLNLLVAFWLLLSLWLLPELTPAQEGRVIGIALALIPFSLIKGTIRERVGSWDRWII